MGGRGVCLSGCQLTPLFGSIPLPDLHDSALVPIRDPIGQTLPIIDLVVEVESGLDEAGM